MLSFFKSKKVNTKSEENTKNEEDTKSEEHLQNYKNILFVATTILESDNPHRIYDLIYSLGKPYQFEVINMCIKGKPLSRDSAFCIEHLFFKNGNKHFQFKKTDETGNSINYTSCKKKTTIHPSDSLIFAFPWKTSRLLDAFNNIGEKVGDKWKQDPLNHKVVLIHPLNIGYVDNGNHSTVMNIINNEAPMYVTAELNLAPIYEELYTDGQYFRRIKDKQEVDKVASVEFAAIFEIGKLILRNKV
ncbi:DUF6710 family protein (plasmid) [Niallia sp. XMNu-256]|uniref:DUF6710 family protein n=1 Tax=Niallia sp. XMNu-256 TaxID=3082444 RepID=UPI0030D11204